MEKGFITAGFGAEAPRFDWNAYQKVGYWPGSNSSLHPQSGFFPAKSPVTIFEDDNSKEDNIEEGRSKA